GVAEAARLAARTAPVQKPVAAGAELRDPIVAVVGYVDVSVRVGRSIPGRGQLPIAAPALLGTDVPDQGPVGRVHPDLIFGVLRDEDERAASLVDAGAQPDRRGQYHRPGRQRRTGG